MARPGRPERNKAARSFRQLRRFHHVINWDKVFGTHRQRFVDLLRNSTRPEDRLARDPTKLNAVLAEVRARGYGTRDATHTGGYYGGPPHADGLFSIAVPLRDGLRVLGAINMLWLKTAFSIEVFAARHLADLQQAAAEIVNALRKRARRDVG
jgi:IclR family transcriptional regulator, mhp operon transcriptional activator